MDSVLVDTLKSNTSKGIQEIHLLHDKSSVDKILIKNIRP